MYSIIFSEIFLNCELNEKTNEQTTTRQNLTNKQNIPSKNRPNGITKWNNSLIYEKRIGKAVRHQISKSIFTFDLF